MVRNHDSLAATDAERPNQRRSAEEVGIFPLRGRNGDLRKLPQIERKQALLDLLGETISSCLCSIPNISSVMGRRCLSMRRN